MKPHLNLMLIEDSEDDIELIQEALRSCGLNPKTTVVENAPGVIDALKNGSWDAILCDYSMPKLTAHEALKFLKESGHDIPFIVVSGSIGECTAVELLKSGAHDYIIKDRLARLGPAIEREIREAKNRLERKMAAEDLKRWAESLARSNEDLQRFAYVASHDLSEPLRMVSLHIQLVEETLRGRLDEPTRQSIGFAVEGTRRMKSLIEDLLSYSRLELTDPVIREVDCNTVFEAALTNLEITVKGDQAHITRGKLPVLTGDSIQLLQVFQNLLSNALKFRRPDVLPEIHFDSTHYPGKGWVFYLKDNGIGIDPKYFERVFTVFQRLHPREKFSGNGIGLSICKKTIERLGGEIWVESEPGKGSVFSFSLPETSGGKFTRAEMQCSPLKQAA